MNVYAFNRLCVNERHLFCTSAAEIYFFLGKKNLAETLKINRIIGNIYIYTKFDFLIIYK